MDKIDVAIIGAGAVGLATAAYVARPNREVYVLEKNSTFGIETSDRNTEVIHAGMYVKNPLKEKLCVVGKEFIYNIPEDYGVHERVGQLVVASTKADVAALEQIRADGKRLGVRDLKMLNAKQVHDMEPNIEAYAAVWSPSTGRVNAHNLMKYFISKAIAASCNHNPHSGVNPVLYNSEVTSIKKVSDGYEVTVNKDYTFKTKVLINSAGLASDKIAAMAGIDIEAADYQLQFCKGEYFRVSGKHNGKVTRFVSPAPGDVSVGIFIAPDRTGSIRLGPNARYMPKNTIDYFVDEAHKKEFFDSASRILPFLRIEDLEIDQAGIRPKLQADGMPKRDFVIQEESARRLPGLINLIGIDSPGLTSSPAIGLYVSKMVDKLLE